jgi:Ca2+-binding EF-hand superfamily protein
MIEIEDMRELMKKLNKTEEECQALVDQISQNHEEYITFDEFVTLLARIESSLENSDPLEAIEGSPDENETDDIQRPTSADVLDFLNKLENHRRMCEE